MPASVHGGRAWAVDRQQSEYESSLLKHLMALAVCSLFVAAAASTQLAGQGGRAAQGGGRRPTGGEAGVAACIGRRGPIR